MTQEALNQNDGFHEPKRTIGPYEVVKSLGKGGMGEVFLVYDPMCDRNIALKQISPKLMHHEIIKERFLKEARVASKLSHPCIIPIYSIHQNEGRIYYTMPYVEGETLKEIFKSTVEKEKKGLTPHEIGVSIPSLARIFLSVCQAMSYAHSKGVLHRDLKPENIIVGKYGEVFILDWGIAKYIQSQEDDDLDIEIDLPVDENLTRPGKVLGTVNYMAPERAMKSPASIQTEIYALGVILYQILTLKLPFQRKNLENFRRIMRFESLTPPEEIAPYRDMPKQLSLIAQKCLSKDPNDRYLNLEEMIFDLENYIEGRPDWTLCETLSITKKQDWEFQENILLSKHLAITRIIDVIQWYAFMLSKNGYSGNVKLEFSLKISTSKEGIGILMCVPEPSERKGLEDGFCLWLGPPSNPYATLFRSNAEVLSIPSSGIKKDAHSHFCIEKIDNNVKVYVDGALKLNYVSHLPIVGNHVGLLYQDPGFELSDIKVYIGSQHAMVNCLSVPDAFLASKNFQKAYAEYKKIAQSFHGRTEGREAQFRAGITLLEEAKRKTNKKEENQFYLNALDEFERLRGTPGAPLEYLGKSLVYYAQNEIEEEIKCLELALRKYAKHPMLTIVKEQIVFRLHETSKSDRTSAYLFALLCLRLLPEIFASIDHSKLLTHLTKHLHPLPFINQDLTFSEKKYEYLHIAMQLAFWVNKHMILLDIIETLPEHLPERNELVSNAIFCMIHLGFQEFAKEKLEEQKHFLSNIQNENAEYLIQLSEISLQDSPSTKTIETLLKSFKKSIGTNEIRSLYFLLDRLSSTGPQKLLEAIAPLDQFEKNPKLEKSIDIMKIKLLLQTEELQKLEELFSKYEQSDLKDARSLLYFFQGCLLWKSKGRRAAIDHLSKVPLDTFAHPHILAAHTLLESLPPYLLNRALFWEKIQMYRKLELFYTCTGKEKNAKECRKEIEKLAFTAHSHY